MAGGGQSASDELAQGLLRPSQNGLGREHPIGREQVADIQRTRLFAAMVEVSAELGVANVTVAHVVERAGVSRRTFYELFSDREECFLGAFDDGVARARRYALDSYDPMAGWAEQIRTSLIGLLSFLDVERGVGQLLIVGSLGAGASALERRRRVLAHMIAVVDEGREETKNGAELPSLTAEGVVGGVISVLHARLLASRPAKGGTRRGDPGNGSLIGLTGPLMGMIVLPYLGPAAARRELAKPIPETPANARHAERNPLGELEMRLTYRTVRVLLAVAASPGDSNRAIADRAGIGDQGQISKLLSRLEKLGLVSNAGFGIARGAPNAWTLTQQGEEVHGVLTAQTRGS